MQGIVHLSVKVTAGLSCNTMHMCCSRPDASRIVGLCYHTSDRTELLCTMLSGLCCRAAKSESSARNTYLGCWQLHAITSGHLCLKVLALQNLQTRMEHMRFCPWTSLALQKRRSCILYGMGELMWMPRKGIIYSSHLDILHGQRAALNEMPCMENKLLTNVLANAPAISKDGYTYSRAALNSGATCVEPAHHKCISRALQFPRVSSGCVLAGL